jgi:glutathione S-transferase
MRMRTLHHHWLSGPSRAVRLALAEKGLEFELVLEKPWERAEHLLELNPAGEVPVLVDADGTVVVGPAVLEYLEERHPSVPLLPDDLVLRAEIRRLMGWFDDKFAREVTDNLVGEKAWKRLAGSGHPQPQSIRAGLANVHYHLDYIGWLADRRTWLAGPRISLADLAAAAQISTVDYIGDVPWDDHPDAKDWYARIKSRPSFRGLLTDQIAGMPPPPHYADLDF